MSTAVTPYNQSTNFLFNPVSISSCCLWLDASYTRSLVFSAGKLSQWNDLSPRAFNAVQGTGIYQPVVNSNAGPNGLTTISFTGTQNMSISSNMDFGSNDWFIFAAVKIPTLSGVGRNILGKNAFQTLPQYRLAIDVYNDVEFIQYTPTTLFISSNATPTANQWAILSGMGYRSGSLLYYNGTPKNTTAALNGSLAMPTVTNYLGSIGPTGTNCWNSDIGEIIIYSNVGVSTLQRQQVEGYLAWKWGAQSYLPTTHPYYNNAYLSNSYPISYFPPRFTPTSVIPSGFIIPQTISQYIYSAINTTNLALWLDSSELSTIRLSGSNVTQWYDKSGKTTTTVVSQPTLSGKYINNFQTLRFNNNRITATLANAIGTGDYALFCVWLTINGGTEVVLSVGSNGNNGALGYNGTYYNLFEWGQTESDFTSAKNQYVVQSGTRISAVKSLFVNGSNAPTASGALNLLDNNIYIGNSGFAINGEICELLVYSNTISINQRQQVEGYLAWKWNLNKSLPNSHPFYLFPPG